MTKYTPKKHEWFHAFVTKTKAVNGFACDIPTRNGPYECTSHVLSLKQYVTFVIAEDGEKTKFKFPTNLFRFEALTPPQKNK